VVAFGLLAALAGGELALQAAALGRPPATELELVRMLRALAAQHGSRATLDLNGRTYRAVCTQAWTPHRRVAQVVTPRLGVAIQVGDRLVSTGALDSGAFELAGCPRPLLRVLSSDLARGVTVHLRRSGGALELSVRPYGLPLDVFVAPTSGLPVRLSLDHGVVDGASRVRYGLPQ